MSFRKDVPNYKSYDESVYCMNTVPNAVYGKLEGLIRRAADGDKDKLKAIINAFSEVIPCQPTTNWGYSYLEQDISYIVFELRRVSDARRFEKFMDCVAVLYTVGRMDIDELNDFLEDNNIGYLAEDYNFIEREVKWVARDTNMPIDVLDAVQNSVKSVSEQAFEEFGHAKNDLQHLDERARKDAVRSCASAMEAVIKEYGCANEIGDATSNLRQTQKYGPDRIVKDGNSIFSDLHRLYPDLRHGAQSEEKSVMTLEEAYYWIERIACFVQYLVSVYNKNK